MGQTFGSCADKFPKSFEIFQPSSRHCQGPGLVEDLTTPTRDIYPKCFEGAHLKLRTKLGDTFKIGYNVVFSTITPSGGQAVFIHNNKDGNTIIGISPNGSLALASTYQLTTKKSIEVSSQIQLNRLSVTTAFLKHTGLNYTSSLNFACCHLPFGIPDIQNAFLVDGQGVRALQNVQKYYGTWGAECVHKVNQSWAIGCELISTNKLRIIACKQYARGRIGMLLEMGGAELFWLRQLTPRLEIGGTCNFDWNKNSPSATLAASWRTSTLIAKASLTTDGMVSTSFRRTIFRTEDKLFAITLCSVLNHKNNNFLLGAGIEGHT